MKAFDDHQHWIAAIADYLARHPHASDTLEGIGRWWLGADQADWPQIQFALASLEREGAVVRKVAADGRAHYRLGPLPRPARTTP